MTKRPSAHKRGYTREWVRESKTFLAQPENALCVYCKRNGFLVAAIQVDHIIPHRGDQNLFWDRSNWQGLCGSCGGEKSARERVYYRSGKPVIVKGSDVNGLPVDPDHPWNQ